VVKKNVGIIRLGRLLRPWPRLSIHPNSGAQLILDGIFARVGSATGSASASARSFSGSIGIANASSVANGNGAAVTFVASVGSATAVAIALGGVHGLAIGTATAVSFALGFVGTIAARSGLAAAQATAIGASFTGTVVGTANSVSLATGVGQALIARAGLATANGLATARSIIEPGAKSLMAFWLGGSSGPSSLLTNLVTDWGAVSGGSSATNSTALENFRTWARAQTAHITLIIPAGTYSLANTAASVRPFDGIRSLDVQAYGATFDVSSSGIFRFGAWGGFRQDAGFSARLYSVASGLTQATCKTASQASLFPVGRWACLAALELQGEGGYPPNHHYIQYVQIVSTNSSTGVIQFTPAANQNYSSAYPTTSAGAYDTGGPVTLFLMAGLGGESDIGWDCDHEYYGLTILNTQTPPQAFQAHAVGRNVRLIDCTFNGIAFAPTVCQSLRLDGCTFNDASIEVDKEIEYLEFKDCTMVGVLVQSSSVTNLVFDGCTASFAMRGTARHTTLTDCTTPVLRLGPQGYGNSESVTITNCTIDALETSFNRYLTTEITTSNGNIKLDPNILGSGARLFLPASLLVTGGNSRWSGKFTSWATGWSSMVVAGDYPAAIVNTDYPEPLPLPPSSVVGSPLHVMQHPIADVAASLSTGCVEIVELCSAAAQHKPLYSYINRTGAPEAQEFFTQWGELESITINVTQVYTGAQATCTFQFFVPGMLDATGADAGALTLIVNAKIAGSRIITPTTITGAQSGDSLGSAPGAVWSTAGGHLSILENISGDTEAQKPIINVEYITTQMPDVDLVLDSLDDLPP
jgi:hypothetical protein